MPHMFCFIAVAVPNEKLDTNYRIKVFDASLLSFVTQIARKLKGSQDMKM